MGKNFRHASLPHYRILSRLGSEVYLAEVTRLERRVTIPEFTADAERMGRFPIEAETASALSHPHKVRVHDIWENGVGRFPVMEEVEGRSRLERTN